MTTPFDEKKDRTPLNPRAGLFFDTETNGLGHTDYIWSLSWVTCNPNTGEWEATDQYINPLGYPEIGGKKVSLNPKATEVNGLTWGKLTNEGRDPKQVLQEFFADCSYILNRGGFLGAFNASFDASVVTYWARTLGVPVPDWSRLLDVLFLDKHFYFRKGRRRLVDVAEFYNVDLGDDAHASAADATATAQILEEMYRRGSVPIGDGESVEHELHRMADMPAEVMYEKMPEWYRKSQHSLHKFFVKKEAEELAKFERTGEGKPPVIRSSSVNFDYPLVSDLKIEM